MIDTKDVSLANVIEAIIERDIKIADLQEKLDIAVKALENINNKNRKFFELTSFEAFFIAVKDDVGEALSKIRR